MQKIRAALAWRTKPMRRRVRAFAAFLWRRMLMRTTVVAVTGSVGKTTTKELIRAILSAHGRAVCSPGNDNLRRFGSPEATILRTRPWDRFLVMEAGVERPGDMRAAAHLIRPDVAVVLEVKRCHTNTFKTVDNIAKEKGEIVRSLRPSGTAVLNADNPYVADMAQLSRARTVSYGRNGSARIRLLHARSRWPERLTLRILYEGEEYDVRTRLVGEHWAGAVLAALTTATVCGLAIRDAIAAIATVEPFWARTQPVTLPSSGATLIRDEWNGSIDTFEAAFKVMEDASAARKIFILSDYSDTTTKMRTRAKRLGRRAAEIGDLVIFVGDYADRSVAAAIAAGTEEKCARGFFTLDTALAFLRSELRAGDLVLLKGQTNHHLSRLYLGLLGEIDCKALACPRQVLCDQCEHLGLEWEPELRGLMQSPSE